MKALVLTGTGVSFDPSRPEPQPGPSDCVLRVTRAGICGTDLQLAEGYKGGFRGVPGHEFVGLVESAPSRPEIEGRRAVAEINVSCGSCATCAAGRRTHCPARSALGIFGRDGAFAERVAIPIVNLRFVPDDVTDDQAVFVEPLAAAARVAEQAPVGPQTRVVVVGDGRLGLLVAQVLAAEGADVTQLGRHAAKLAISAARGVRGALRRDDVAGDADVVVECTGSPSGLETALSLVRPEGTVVLKTTCAEPGSSAASPRAAVDWNRIVVDEISIVGSRCGPFDRALHLLASRSIDVEPLIAARYRLEDGAAAFRAAGSRGTLKVLFDVS